MTNQTKSEKDRVVIFDTTLRDGEQCPGATMTFEEKLEVADLLDTMGVDIIEAGFPIASDGDFEAVREIARRTKNAVVCGLSRAGAKDIDRCAEAIRPAKQGRIHTSTATVAVLPEIEETEVVINAGDLRIDTFCAGGKGGQSVNTTKSAVRITHLPTGLAVAQQTEKSQLKNKNAAMKLLRSRLYDLERSRIDSERSAQRKGQVGSGDRSERIRTYNFPQGRVTDHRINLTLYNLPKVIEGEALGEIIDALVAEHQAALLAAEA